MRARAPRAEGGFTLLEVLAVMMLVSLVLGVAIDFYLDLARASNHATASTRRGRRAAAIVDRVARDLEGAVLVKKPDEVDPLTHPWIFLADPRYGELGADRLKFVTRNHRPRSSQAHESDLMQVAYVLRRDAHDGFELLRWTSPQLPEGLDRSFPRDESDGAQVLASDLAAFGVRLLRDDGDWADRWDSSTLVDSSELPVAAEISVRLSGDDAAEDAAVVSRQVLLPVRPLDLQALFHPGQSPPDDAECAKVDACIEGNRNLLREEGFSANELDQVRERYGEECVSDAGDDLPFAGLLDRMEGCE